MILCINSILRRQWIEAETLSHPIIQLPLAMTMGGVFWRSQLLWVRLALAGFIDLVNSAHFLVPAIPGIPVRQRDISYLFTENPFNAMGSLPIFFYPFAIGLCFFAPLDLTFSVWFFYLCSKAQRVLGGITGWQKITSFPYYDEQMFGAALVVFFFAPWGGREHLKNIFKTAFVSDQSKGDRDSIMAPGLSRLSDANEPISYQGALLAMAGGTLFLILFCSRARMSIWVVALYFGICFTLWTTISRIRA